MSEEKETKALLKNLIKNAEILNLATNNKYQEAFEKKYNESPILHGKPTQKFKAFIVAVKKKSEEKNKSEKYSHFDTCMQCGKLTMINSGTASCKKCDSIEEKPKRKKSSPKTDLDELVIEGSGETIEINEGASRILTPAVFRKTYEEVWIPVIKEEQEMYLSGKKRIKGFIILLEGFAKAGKTHFAQSSVEFKGYKSKYRDIPKGRPAYIIEADAANIDEVETKWYKYLPNKQHPEGWIHIKNCYVRDEESGLIDPEATLENMFAAIFSLRNRKEGTLIVDPFTLMCDLVLFVYMLKHKDKEGEFDITFDEFLKPSRQITIFEHQYKKKLIYEILRLFRNFKINIILIVNLKDKYTESDNMYDQRKTGQHIADVQKGTEYWVDVIGRMFKRDREIEIKLDDGSTSKKIITTRHLAIMDCRFEDKQMDSDKYIFEAPTFEQVINKLMEVYPK